MMSENDLYKTIDSRSEGIFRDKGSKFIAYACPFNEEESLKDVLSEIKSLHPKARHHCWAYRLTPDREVYRVNDDGEPSGSAGRPILNCLLSFDVTDVIVIVVRYFGGTLLGVPGLINAYKQSTQESLRNANIVERTVNYIYIIQFEYLLMNDIMKMIKEHQWTILKQDFDLDCKIKIELRKNDVPRFIELVEKLNGASVQRIR